jgi:hypothetical protein
LLEVNPKVNAEIADGSVIIRCNVKIVQTTMVEITVTKIEEIVTLFVTNRYISGRNGLN